jgi:biopolymer transport protein ExbB
MHDHGKPIWQGLTAVLAAGTVMMTAMGAAQPVRPRPKQALDHWRLEVERMGRIAWAWFQRTPAPERVAWGGLAACGLLGAGVTLERSCRLRRVRIVPRAFRERFLQRVLEGQIDRGKGLDYCELNPSPAARVALAAVRRWGRPVGDLERAVILARQLEQDRLRHNVPTLRRLAVLAPLIGLLGSLMRAGTALGGWHNAGGAMGLGPVLSAALGPLTVGVALAILAVITYDGLAGRVDALTLELDRIGAEVVDAIASFGPVEARGARPRTDGAAPQRPPHPIRLPIPGDVIRQLERDRE